MGINTDLLHSAQHHAQVPGTYEPAAMTHISPIYQTSTYILEDFDSAVYLNQNVEDGFVYTRFGSPNCDELEKRMAILEKGEAGLSVASGMGAISIDVMSSLKAGDHAVIGDVIYGCSYTLFEQVLTDLELKLLVLIQLIPRISKKLFKKIQQLFILKHLQIQQLK